MSTLIPALPPPLLSICIPTWNRIPFLTELLECLLPQLLETGPRVELVVSDNASDDGTGEVVASFIQRGLPIRYLLSQENAGADANFLKCLDQARGKYVWVLGDDDLLTPEAVPRILALLELGETPTPSPASGATSAPTDFDLVYLSSFGFSGAYTLPPARQRRDKLGRFAEVVTSGSYFLEKVNALVGLISVVIVNKHRLLATGHPPFEQLRKSNLMQAGWIFPVLHRRCRVLYVWQRLVAYRSFNSTGWGVCEVFGVRLGRIATRYFAAEPELARSLFNGTLRYWLPDAIFAIRTGVQNAGMNTENFRSLLQPAFRGNWRYWIFVWPMATLPLALIRLLHPVFRVVNKLTRAVQAVSRNLLHHGQYLHPIRHPEGS